MATYTLDPQGSITLQLSAIEASGLRTLAGEGATAILGDREGRRNALGGPAAIEAARRALAVLEDASAHAQAEQL